MGLVEDISKTLKSCDEKGLEIFERVFTEQLEEAKKTGDSALYEMTRSILGLCSVEKLRRETD